MKSARLIGDSKFEDLVAMSFYNSKLVYFIPNACKKVEWIKNNRELWHKKKVKMSMLNFLSYSSR